MHKTRTIIIWTCSKCRKSVKKLMGGDEADMAFTDPPYNVNPTMKPIALIACEKTRRTCYTMEMDPGYCDVIKKRWEEFTGEKSTKLVKAKGRKRAS